MTKATTTTVRCSVCLLSLSDDYMEERYVEPDMFATGEMLEGCEVADSYVHGPWVLTVVVNLDVRGGETLEEAAQRRFPDKRIDYAEEA